MKLNSPKTYNLTTALILFLVGVLGFAFHDNFDLPDKYLLVSLVLGFWGLIVVSGTISK